VVGLDADGRLVNVLSLEIGDGTVQAVRSVINPEKLVCLSHLTPLADLRELLGTRHPRRTS
jgi:RNA polymerase sigma-70 factor (ECF subfamily)